MRGARYRMQDTKMPDATYRMQGYKDTRIQGYRIQEYNLD